jgi:hypothetical protein
MLISPNSKPTTTPLPKPHHRKSSGFSPSNSSVNRLHLLHPIAPPTKLKHDSVANPLPSKTATSSFPYGYFNKPPRLLPLPLPPRLCEHNPPVLILSVAEDDVVIVEIDDSGLTELAFEERLESNFFGLSFLKTTTRATCSSWPFSAVEI